MKIKALSLQGFRTFREKQVFNIEGFSKGLHFITGSNLVEARLGGNASGKSNLQEAITVCFFGKTSTNLKADNIISWDLKKGESCEISVTVEKLGNDYIIKRTCKPNTLTLTNVKTNVAETISQEKLEEFLNCNFESFLYSTHIAQFTSKFIDLRPAEKMEVFTDILQDELKKWEDLSETCKVKSEEISKEITELNNNIIFQEGKLDSLKNNSYDNEIEKWEKEKQRNFNDFDTQLEYINNQYKEINKQVELFKVEIVKIDLSVYDVRLKDFNSSITGINNSYEELEKEQNLIKNDIQKVEKEITILKTTLDINNREHNKFASIKETKCPSCKQIVTKEHIEKELNTLKEKSDKLNNEIVNYTEIKAELTKKLNAVNDRVQEIEKKYNDINKELTLLESSKAKDKDKLQGFKLQQTLLVNKLDSLKKEGLLLIDKKKSYEQALNPFIRLKEDNNYSINLYKRLIDGLKLQVSEKEGVFEPVKYWIKAFKEIKLLVLEEKLKELEIYINNVLPEFGIADWKVTLKTFNETKSGNIKNEFNILITSPINDGPVPFECWSGGLGQRLRLATTLGLASFIQNNKEAFDIEMFDEPTAWLSQEGIEDLLVILSNRAKNENKKIFITDHKNLHSSGVFESLTTIVKDKNGSKIIS